MTTATITLLKNAGQNWMPAVSTRLTFSRKFPCGIGDGIGLRAMSAAVHEDSRNA